MELELERVAWAERGWPLALAELAEKARGWREQWIFLQYTALAWSTRGFPLRFLSTLRVLRAANARIAVVYHDVEPYGGRRVIDILRRQTQVHIMRRAVRMTDLAIFTVPIEKLSWGPAERKNNIFIPVSANLPIEASTFGRDEERADSTQAVSVFGITGGQEGAEESATIANAIRFAINKTGRGLRLVVLGRNSESAEANLKNALRDLPVQVQVFGVLSAEEVVRALRCSDVLLFVRGPISSRRSSAIAGIACGLPVIAMTGSETAAPITEAGTVLLDRADQFGEALSRVLTDDAYRASLAERSRAAQRDYFSWSAIAAKYAKAIRDFDEVDRSPS
ncbi:MAG TPA: glycosyltransferase [Candidatus Acidoferrum sp.]